MDQIRDLLDRYRRKGILIDTNLLLLFVVGSCNVKHIGTFKRTKKFIPADFEALRRMLGNFRRLVTTPNILTEVSNFLGQLPTGIQPEIFSKYSELI